jgi:DNA helicase-2/ATP-dependent DNA helicase PcrA
MNIFPNSGIRRRTPGEIRSSADLLPEEAPAAPKQGGFPEEERNIFYVALTRSKKFLFLTDSDRYGGKSYAPSPLLALARESAQLLPFQDLPYPGRQLPVMHREPDPITLNFTLLSDYFDCPYRFKLSAFYGFTPPIRPQQGYGAMLHEVMMHLHRLWLAGERPGPDQVREIVRRSLFLPYADRTILARAGKSAEANALAYWRQNGQDAGRIRHAELDIDLQLGEGVNVNGRIDLIRTYETEGGERLAIIDLKSAGKDAEECLNADQLKIYALGYRERTGEMADRLMIYNLDVPDGSANTQEPVDPALLERTKERIRAAVRHIRAGDLPRKPGAVCETCRLRNLCRRQEA